MSILESMVSTMKRYKSDNIPVLQNANIRGEYLYQVRLCVERAMFISAQSGILRMQVLLAFIEARAAVIDAVIKTDGNLHFLSIICSSVASPLLFSQILKRAVPRAIIEELTKDYAEECIYSRAVRDEEIIIPSVGTIRSVHESRRALLFLLLEYRALLSEFNNILPDDINIEQTVPSRDLSLPFLLFEQDGSICGIPDSQIEQISPGGNGSFIIQLHHIYGQRLIICEELLCIKEIDIVTCTFKNKKSKGYYQISTRTTGGNFDFTLVVPSFL